jgi:hypothetical protein
MEYSKLKPTKLRTPRTMVRSRGIWSKFEARTDL